MLLISFFKFLRVNYRSRIKGVYEKEKAMINKLNIILCFILCTAILGGASNLLAQTQNGADKILVAGKQPLRQSDVDKVIEFYEWAFETQFSADERMRFQQFSVEAFRQDALTSYQNMETLIKASKVVRSKDAASQKKMRDDFNESFVNDLRTSDSESSQLLLGIYERSKSVENSNTKVSTDSNNSSSLVGTWMRSSGPGGARSYDGVTKYNSGENVTFEFSSNGTMQYVFDKKVLSITQCRISEVTKLSGTYKITGNQLIMNLTDGNTVATSSCEAKGNFKKNLSASTLTKNFIVKKLDSVFRPDEPLLLCFDGSGDEACFERDPKK